MAGKLIVIAGTDGSGKATQTEILVKRLREEGHEVEIADFPRYGKRSASLVEDYLNGKFGDADEVGPFRASVFFACDRYAASSQIKKWLAEGKIVISNRYVESNLGHQGGKIKDKEEREKFWNWTEELEYEIFGIPKPDATIFFYVTPEIGQQLVDKKGAREYVGGEKRDIHEDDINHLKNASEAYLQLLEKHPSWTRIDCVKDNQMLSKEEISEKVFNEIKKLMGSS